MKEDSSYRNGARTVGWLMPALFGILLTGAIGYIGIIHQLAIRMGARVDVIAETQQRSTYIVNDVEDLKKRMLQTEIALQQVPYLSRQSAELHDKLDRLVERMHTMGRERMGP